MSEEFKPPVWVQEVTVSARKQAVTAELEIVAFVNGKDGLVLVPISMIPFSEAGMAKEAFAVIVRRLAIELEASEVLVVSEAFTKSLDNPTKEQLEEVQERPIREAKGAKEVLLFSFESMEGCWAATVSLEGALPNREVGLAEFIPFKGEGRLTNYLPDKNSGSVIKDSL